jgi:regulator of replication initiation timing
MQDMRLTVDDGLPRPVENAVALLTQAFRKELLKTQSRMDEQCCILKETVSQNEQLRQDNHTLRLRVQDEHIKRTSAERVSQDAEMKKAAFERRQRQLEAEYELLKAAKRVCAALVVNEDDRTDDFHFRAQGPRQTTSLSISS